MPVARDIINIAAPSARLNQRRHSSYSLNTRGLSRSPRAGFTLLEVLLALFILALVLSAVWSSYRDIFSLTKEGEGQARAYQSARAAMDILGRDLMALAPFRGHFVFSAASEVKGNKDYAHLFFSAKNRGNIWDEAQPAGINKVLYQVSKDSEGRNHLHRETALLPAVKDSKEQGFVVCEDVEALYLRFYDGEKKLHESWETAAPPGGKPGPLPRMVELELHLQEGETRPPRRFFTRFLLPLARDAP